MLELEAHNLREVEEALSGGMSDDPDLEGFHHSGAFANGIHMHQVSFYDGL
jgi:hypothetical protein